MDAKRLTEWLGSIGGLVTTLTSALTAVSLFYVAVTGTIGSWAKDFGLSDNWARPVALVLLVVLIFWVWRSYRRFGQASRVERPQEFTLAAATAEGLIGREQDLSKLLETVIRNRIVLLDGESGCGKSALVSAGLVPRLARHGRILPVLLRDWGEDWVRGPLASTLGALFDSLTEEERAQIEWNKAPDLAAAAASLAAEVEARFDAVGRVLNRIPLLIADQFDDYQAQERERFSDSAGNWIAPDELAAGNHFWGFIKTQLLADKMQLLVVTRSDTASGMSCVRFLSKDMTADRSLPRVDIENLRPLLASVAPPDAKPEIVSNPENGWNDLRNQLENELRLQGAILMQQVRTLFHGLRLLPMLTIGAYRKAGGHLGLEVLMVKRALERASRQACGENEVNHVRAILGALVLPGGPNRQAKTKRCLESELHQLIGDPEKCQKILQVLQEEDLVRPATRAEGHAAWQLDHDFLARAVTAEARQADRWGVALSEGYARFRQVHGWRSRWSALLPIEVQIRLLWERLRGRLAYGEALHFARLSTLKPAATFVFAALLAIGGHIGYDEWNLSRQATAISDRFGGPNEAAAVLELWRAPSAVRERLFLQARANPAILDRATASRWPLAHIGLSTEQLPDIAEVLRNRLERGDKQGALIETYLGLAQRIRSQEQVRTEVAALRGRLSSHREAGLIGAYSAVVPKLAGREMVMTELKSLRDLLMQAHKYESELGFEYQSFILSAYSALARRLTSQEDIRVEVVALRSCLEHERNVQVMRNLASAYTSVAPLLVGQPDIEAEVTALRARLENEGELRLARQLASSYAAVAQNLKGQVRIKAELAAVGGHLFRKADASTLDAFAIAYISVAPHLIDQKQIGLEVRRARAHLQYGFDELSPLLIFRYAQIYTAASGSLTGQAEIEAELAALQVHLTGATSSIVIEALIPAYAALASNVTNPVGINVHLEFLRARFFEEKYSTSTKELAEAYNTVAQKLAGQDQILAELTALFSRLDHAQTNELKIYLIRAYSRLAKNLTDQIAIESNVDLLHSRLELEPSGVTAKDLAVAYGTLGQKLNNRAKLSEELLYWHARLEKERDGDHVEAFATAYATVAGRQLELLLKDKAGPAASGTAVAQILTMAGHPFLGDPSALLASLEPAAQKSFGTDIGMAVNWWVETYKGDPSTLRPAAPN